jgi:hypothetical protein
VKQMGYYLMKCRKELNQILLEIIKIENYDEEKKQFLVEKEDIEKIDSLFYKYGFSEKVRERELLTNNLFIDREHTAIKKVVA